MTLVAVACDNDKDDAADDAGESASEDAGTSTSGEPAIECELRETEELCRDTSIMAPQDGTKTDGCLWAPELIVVSSGMACETAVTESRCLARDISTMPGCVTAPCSTGVLFRIVGDQVELLPWNKCGGNPKDFRDCQWDASNVATLPECDCACG